MTPVRLFPSNRRKPVVKNEMRVYEWARFKSYPRRDLVALAHAVFTNLLRSERSPNDDGIVPVKALLLKLRPANVDRASRVRKVSQSRIVISSNKTNKLISTYPSSQRCPKSLESFQRNHYLQIPWNLQEGIITLDQKRICDGTMAPSSWLTAIDKVSQLGQKRARLIDSNTSIFHLQMKTVTQVSCTAHKMEELNVNMFHS